MLYVVNEDYPTSTAVIHLSDCPEIEKNGGFSTDPPNGKYHKDIESPRAAKEIAARGGMRTIKICWYCKRKEWLWDEQLPPSSPGPGEPGHRCIH